MAREIRPWYRSSIQWSSISGITICVLGIYLSWQMLRNGEFVISLILGLSCFLVLLSCIKSAWRNRNPFIFSVRGNRKVKFISSGRDETIFEENGRRINIYTELWSKPNRGIYASSIQKWESPHENEILTDDKKQDILALLCENYDYYGVTYDIVKD